VTSSLLVSPGDTAVLQCQVTGNPLSSVEHLITWSRGGYDMSRAVVDAPSVDRSRLTIAHVDRRDAGAFHCRVFNGVHPAWSATAELIIKCKALALVTTTIRLRFDCNMIRPFDDLRHDWAGAQRLKQINRSA